MQLVCSLANQSSNILGLFYSAWLHDSLNATVAAISNRIEAITGLSQTKAELLQVQNYGIGGQYEPHFDHARVSYCLTNHFSLN